MENQPLGLPSGSIRAIIILMMSAFIFFALIFAVTIPKEIYTMWIAGVAYYLGMRTSTIIN
jgi:hypothetical protein